MEGVAKVKGQSRRARHSHWLLKFALMWAITTSKILLHGCYQLYATRYHFVVNLLLRTELSAILQSVTHQVR